MAVARGAIKNHERARQQHDFSGLRFGNITPTDSDGEIEYENKCYVFLEFKYGECSLDGWGKSQRGQRLAFERKADNLNRVKPTLLVLARHWHPPEEDVDAARATVIAYRINGAWREPGSPKTVHSCVEWFLTKHGYIPQAKTPVPQRATNSHPDLFSCNEGCGNG